MTENKINTPTQEITILCKDLTDRTLLKWMKNSLTNCCRMIKDQMNAIDGVIRGFTSSNSALLSERHAACSAALSMVESWIANLDLGMRIVDGKVDGLEDRVWDVV